MGKFLESCELNLSWMRNSGIMSQGDGEWGVAERLVTTGGNAAMDKIRHSFPAISEHEGYVIVEQRRSDCNFEAALLFALHGQFHHDSSSETTAKNLLDFLFFRSGLLNRTDETSVIGAWNWSHIQRRYGLWFDDDGWVAAMELVLARLFPHLDERYQLREWGRLQALDLLKAFQRTFTAAEPPREKYTDPKAVYQGRLELPHWAVPTLCALVMLAKEPDTDQETGRQVDAQLDAYLQFAFSRMDTFNGSELGYLTILGALLNWNGDAPQPHRRLLEEAVLRIQNRIDANPEYGIPPAEHFEAPTGPEKADLIYTLNWDFLGMVLAAFCDRKFLPTARSLGEKLVEMQDTSPDLPFHGCWRGMFDCKKRTYGGGNCYEGGAGSIYSGWTNAPIALGMLLLDHLIENNN